MYAYITLDGRVFNLDALKPAEREYFDECRQMALDEVPWSDFAVYVHGEKNPLVAAAGGRVTDAVWQHPLFQVLKDLDYRVGIAQEKVASSPGDDVADPLRLASETVTTTEAARHRGVTVQAIHGAIERGELLADSVTKGRRRVVHLASASVDQWTPSPERQRAGRRGGIAKAASA